MYVSIAIRHTVSAKNVQRNPTAIRIPMVAQPTHHHHHLQGHGPQHLTLAQEMLGARVGALPQDGLITQDGGTRDGGQKISIQIGMTLPDLPQSIVLSMQPTYMDAYLFVFAECTAVAACIPRGLPVLETMYFDFRSSAIIPRGSLGHQCLAFFRAYREVCSH